MGGGDFTFCEHNNRSEFQTTTGELVFGFMAEGLGVHYNMHTSVLLVQYSIAFIALWQWQLCSALPCWLVNRHLCEVQYVSPCDFLEHSVQGAAQLQ
jgi:hypothetical protein